VLALAHISQAVDRRVNEVMRSNVITYDENAPIALILNCLIRTPIRSVVITAAGEPCGLISRSALVRWLLENHWNVAPNGEVRSPCDADGINTGDDESALVEMAAELAVEAQRLYGYLQSSHPEDATAPIIGGASRMQRLIDELLAGSASGNRTGSGLPF